MSALPDIPDAKLPMNYEAARQAIQPAPRSTNAKTGPTAPLRWRATPGRPMTICCSGNASASEREQSTAAASCSARSSPAKAADQKLMSATTPV